MVHEVATREVVRIPGEGIAVAETVARRAALLRRVSWGAIVAGTGVALAMQLLFTTLGAAIGLAAIDPGAPDAGRGMAIGAGIWWLITGLISLFIGGMVAGRLAGFPQRVEAALHGVMVWSLTAMIGVLMLTTSAAALIGGALGPMARSYAESSPYDSRDGKVTSGLSAMGNEAINQLNRLGTPNPETDKSPIAAAPAEVVPPTPTGTPTDRPTMTEYEARKAAPTLAGAALWSFFALLLGSGAACMGGQTGRPPIGVTLE